MAKINETEKASYTNSIIVVGLGYTEREMEKYGEYGFALNHNDYWIYENNAGITTSILESSDIELLEEDVYRVRTRFNLSQATGEILPQVLWDDKSEYAWGYNLSLRLDLKATTKEGKLLYTEEEQKNIREYYKELAGWKAAANAILADPMRNLEKSAFFDGAGRPVPQKQDENGMPKFPRGLYFSFDQCKFIWVEKPSKENPDRNTWVMSPDGGFAPRGIMYIYRIAGGTTTKVCTEEELDASFEKQLALLEKPKAPTSPPTSNANIEGNGVRRGGRGRRN